jgi:hypothetical protein
MAFDLGKAATMRGKALKGGRAMLSKMTEASPLVFYIYITVIALGVIYVIWYFARRRHPGQKSKRKGV